MSVFKPKRGGKESATYYCYFRHKGKRIQRNTGFPDLARAEQFERHLRRRLEQEDATQVLDQVRQRQAPAPAVATIGKLLAAYKATPLDASAAVRTANANCLKNILRQLGHENPQDCSSAILEPGLAAQWFNLARTRAEAAQDQAAANRIRRTANSIANQACAILTPPARAALRDAGIALPDSIPALLEAVRERRFSRVAAAAYNPPDEALIRQTLDAWETLKDRNLYLAIGLELTFGLRKAEVSQARWDWHRIREGVPCLDNAAAVKNRTGHLLVRALDPFYTTWITRARAENWIKKGETILEGHDTERTELVFRRVSTFLRNHGWATQKTNHALRAYSGSQVAMRYGIWEACTWLRHASVQTTERHYSHFVRRIRPENLETLPCKWAAPAATWTPKILPAVAG